jgi:hypothetical protein
MRNRIETIAGVLVLTVVGAGFALVQGIIAAAAHIRRRTSRRTG